MKANRIAVSTLVLGLMLALVAGLSVQLPQGAAHAQDPDQQAQPEGITAPQAQVGTAFTYQGLLTDGGSPANGVYDFRFSLYADPTASSLVARSITIEDQNVEQGLFTVQLGFGRVFTGTARYLEIAVRPGTSGGAFTTLSPRQELTPVPYALALPGLWTQQNPTSTNIIGGSSGNRVSPGVVGAVIGGGGKDSSPNAVMSNSDYATIGGGEGNDIADVSPCTTIGGGGGNGIGNYSDYSTIGGGGWNDIGDYSDYSTIGGGGVNVITLTADFATIPGGFGNVAAGHYAFAAGRQAYAIHDGCFVWGDSTNEDIACVNSNRTIFRSTGGFYIYTNTDLNAGSRLAAGGSSWGGVSARHLKENFAPVDTQELLARLAEHPITTWNYKAQDPSIRHIGPMAEDFNSLLDDLGGEGEGYINSLDADGVALAAIQGLYAQNQELLAQVNDLEARLAALERGGVSPSSAFGLPSWLLLGGLVLVGGVVLQRRRAGGEK